MVSSIMPRRRINELLDRLARTEERFLQSDFLAPAVRGGVVAVRIGVVVCPFRIERRFTGWGVFRPAGPDRAELIRRASLAERASYLALVPAQRVILCHRIGREWLGWPEQHGDHRFGPPALLPVRLAEEAEAFAIVATGFDGAQCWFDQLDERADPTAAAYLRRAFAEHALPESLQRRGLTAEERAAYAAAVQLAEEAVKDRTEARLRAALTHAGGELQGYREQDECYRVEFTVDGERHVSVVGRDLSVQLAGICLSGEDQHFDLQS